MRWRCAPTSLGSDAPETQQPECSIGCHAGAQQSERIHPASVDRKVADDLRIVRGAALVPNLFVIPSGTAQSEPARFFYQLVDRDVFEGLRGLFANVVIDLPPMLHISYGSLACALADRLLIVARSKLTQTADLETMVTRIGRDRLSGVVLTGAEDRIPGWLRSFL